MVDALGEGIFLIGIIAVSVGRLHRNTGEIRIGLNIHAAERVDNLHQSREVHTDIVVRLHPVEVAEHLHRLVDAVESGVGELVQLSVACQRQVVVARRIYQQDLLGRRIDNGENVHVAAALGRDVIHARVDAAAVDHERLLRDGSVRDNRVDLMGRGVGIEHAGLVAEVGVPVLLREQVDIALVDQNRVDLVVIERVGQRGHRIVALGLDRAEALADLVEDALRVLRIGVGNVAEGIAPRVSHAGGGVVVHDAHLGDLRLRHLADDLAQRGLDGVHGNHAVEHRAREQQRHDAHDELPCLVAPQGQLHNHAHGVEHDQHHHQDNQIQVREHARRHQADIQC